MPWIALNAIWFFAVTGCGLLPCNDCIPYPEYKSLHGAASRGDIDMMEDLLRKGGDVNENGRMGDRPLHQAANAGHLKATEFLVARGADVQIKNEIGGSPLHEAAENGHVEMIRYLVGKGVDINVASNTKATPLHEAAENGHADAVAWLLKHGANRNARDLSDKLPVDLAIAESRTDAVKVLLGNGSLLRDRKSYANQLLFQSAGNAGVIAFLLDHKADVNTHTPLRDPYGETGPPLSEGNETPLQKACGRGNTDAIRFLIERGAKVNARDAKGTTPLIALAY